MSEEFDTTKNMDPQEEPNFDLYWQYLEGNKYFDEVSKNIKAGTWSLDNVVNEFTDRMEHEPNPAFQAEILAVLNWVQVVSPAMKLSVDKLVARANRPNQSPESSLAEFERSLGDLVKQGNELAKRVSESLKGELNEAADINEIYQSVVTMVTDWVGSMPTPELYSPMATKRKAEVKEVLNLLKDFFKQIR